MANNVESNFTLKVAKGFLPEFEANTVLLNTVNNQKLESNGLGTPDYGETMKFKRPHQYRSVKTADGDISGSAPTNSIISGTATGTVQEFYTIDVETTILEEAIKLNQLAEIIKPAAQQLVTDVEVDLGQFMIDNSALAYGTEGTAVDAWSDVAGAGALMNEIGIPLAGEKYYTMGSFSQTNLADTQSGLASGDNSLVNTAWQNAQISSRFGGLRALASNALTTYQAGALAGESGTLAATPIATYVAAKDTYQQTLSLTGLTVSTVAALRAGDVLQFTGTGADARSMINLKTRKTVFGSNMAPVNWKCTVLADADTDGAGAATVTVSAAAINEGATGQYNNVSAPLVSGDAFTIRGAADTEYKPNLFYHKEAFGVGTVSLPKLHSTDTVFTTASGISIRCSKYADGAANKNMTRFDLLPAFACFNPLFAGKGWGQP